MKLNSKLSSLAAVALLAFAGSAQAGSFTSYTVAADTATNLDVSWVWNLDLATLAGETSAPSLANWSASATGYKVGTSKYYMDVAADRIPLSAVFEYEAGNWQKGFGTMSFSNSDVISGRTYTLDIVTNPSNSHVWNVHLTGVAPIPEPGEWALMLSGFGLIALMVRRRTANVA